MRVISCLLVKVISSQIRREYIQHYTTERTSQALLCRNHLKEVDLPVGEGVLAPS